jgi:phosphoglycerol transferase MdoB-like AlkP superfamily enzyme
MILCLSFPKINTTELWSAGLLQDVSWSSYGLILILLFGSLLGKLGEQLAILLWLIITLCSNFADFVLLQQWGSRINSQALFYFENTTQAVASLNINQWLVAVFIIFLTLWIAFWGYAKLLKIVNPEKEYRYIKVAFLCIFFSITARGGIGKSPLTIENAMRFKSNIENQLAINSSWNLLYSLIQGNQIPDVSHFRDSSYYHSNYDTLLFPIVNGKAEISEKSKPHIILIVLEGISAELSQFFGGKVATVTPNLDMIAFEGLSFTQAFATGDRTDKGLISILSGWPGHPWQGMLAFPEKSSLLPNLVSDLKGLDYKTSFFYGSDLHFANQRYYFEQSGMDEIQDIKSLSVHSKFKLGSWGIQDAEMLEILANRYLSSPQKEKPQFLSLLTLSTHDPYDAVPQNTGSDKQKMIRTVKYLDGELGKFFERIKKSDKYGNTLVILVSDHGKNLATPETNFGQKGFFHIPMVFTGGALNSKYRNQKVNHVVSQTDVYSTMFYLMGWSKNELENGKLFPKGDRSLLKYSRCGIDLSHPQFAWFNITGVTGIIKGNGAFWLGTDKLSIDAERPLNKQDSTVLNLSTVIVNDFFNLR